MLSLANNSTVYVDGKKMTPAEYGQYLSSRSSSQSTTATQRTAQEQAQDRLKQLQDTWKVGFNQRQQEAETNATRAARYRKEESERNFGQNRTLQGDYLGSQEKREAAQTAARERMQQSSFGQERDMASLRSELKQREKSEDRTAVIAAFRNRR